jgi:tetratricopeptide (TPR) repeat protein
MNSPTEGEEEARLTRQGAEHAIDLAIESKWEEAAALNRSILETQPEDVDTWNRLGKSLLELGRYREAHDAYAKSIELDPVNQIAKRNLERLEGLQDAAPRREGVARVAQDLFIEEVGKTGTTVLRSAPREIVAALTAGDEIYLKPDEDVLQIANAGGDIIGSVEPKLGLRLLRLIQGGNQYAAAVKSLGDTDVEVIIKETYRDPSQTRLSFPATSTGGVRPYIKESLVRRGLDDDDDEIVDDDGDNDEWEGDASDRDSDGNVSLSSIEDSDSDDDEDE